MKARTKKAFAKEKKRSIFSFRVGGPYHGGAIDGLLSKVKSLLPEGLFMPQVEVNDDDVINAT